MSAINTPSSNTHDHTAILCVTRDSSARRPSANPIKPLPASPINNEAGDQFQRRKPAADAARTTDRVSTTSCSPDSPAAASSPTRSTTQLSDVTSNCEAAIPSIPSMKLVRLHNQTSDSTASKLSVSGSESEKKPKSTESTPIARTAAKLTMNCTGNRTLEESCHLSSLNPKTTMNRQPRYASALSEIAADATNQITQRK